ncbi:MAG TPA: methyltransferase domain-containing protein [Longimicrobiales bacterium]|nr:methyltransferase domain-containing protein [Longimicrobiales bacterium]
MFTCPICDRPLSLEGRSYRCEAGHAFDRAREGYVDLLPVGHGRSGITGDTAAMARARQRFLARGHYGRLVDRIVALVLEHAGGRRAATPGDRGRFVVAEAGCGSGHYIGAVADALGEAACFGFDVSRDALRLAARARPAVRFAVNDVRHRVCLPANSTDVLLDVFAPRNVAEFARVLRPDGLLLVVVPGERHLAELRGRLPLLGIEPEKRERTLAQLAPQLEPAWEEALEWEAHLAGDDVADLVRMSPSAFHLDHAGIDTATGDARVTLSFLLLGLTPRADQPFRPDGRPT